MKRTMAYWAAMALLLSGAALGADDGLEGRVDAVLKSPGYENGRWGLLVVDAKTGQPVYQKNADQLFCPASVTKLYSTAAALAELGADYRFQTPVVRKGEVSDGQLKGDLILIARGDLSLGGRTGKDGTLLFENNDHTYAGGHSKTTLVKANPLAGLDSLAREVAAAGIARISGDVIVDDRLFTPASSTGSGPSRVSPIVVNDNLIDVVVTPATNAGGEATVEIVPRTAFVSFDHRVETVAEGEKPSVRVIAQGPRRFSVRGKVPAGGKDAIAYYEVEESAAFARALFIERLRERGVVVGASPLGDNAIHSLPDREATAKLPKVAEYTSPPLKEYLRVILKVSHNLHASTLPLLVATHSGGKTLEDGLKREGELLKGLGVDVSTISFGGGAGGSRSDLVTPRATVALLRAMAARPDYAAYEAALPILGRDGTLAESVGPNSPARGHVWAKTGTYWVDNDLTGKAILTSKALAGAMETASGRRLVFAFFVNDVPLDASTPSTVSDATSAASKLLGRLCEVFYADEKAEASPAR